MKLFIDTSIFVDCLRKDIILSSRHLLESFGIDNIGFTSSITVAELSVGAHLSQRRDALAKLRLIAMEKKILSEKSEFLFYTTEDGKARVHDYASE